MRKFEADFVAHGKVILELKTLKSKFIKANYVQIISELKLWDMHLGLLVNFGLQKVQIERIPFTEKPKLINENYDYVKSLLSNRDRNHLAKLLVSDEFLSKNFDPLGCFYPLENIKR